MITGHDIDNARQEYERNKPDKKLVVVETMQFFEFEIPCDQDPEEFIDSEECRQECAARILNQTTDLTLERVYTTYDPITEQWS